MGHFLPRFARPLAVVLLASWPAACSVPDEIRLACEPTGDPQLLLERPSPYDSATLTRGPDTLAKVCYSRPFARGRTVFGELVPFDTLWRTGANESTTLYLAGHAILAGTPVAPGAYTIYTVPSERQWLAVVNAATGQWGLTRDERGADGVMYFNRYTDEIRRQELGRTPVVAEDNAFTEQLRISFDSLSPDVYSVVVEWADERIILPLQFTSPPVRRSDGSSSEERTP